MITRDSSQTIVFKKCNWSGIDNKNLERIDVHSTSIGFLVSTPNGIYSCDEENKFFYHSGKINLPERQLGVWASPIVEDKNRNMWMAFRYKGEFGTQIAVSWNTNNLDRFTLITSPFEKIRRFHTDVIYPDDNSIVWLGGVDGIVRMDFNQMSIRKTLGNVILSKITMNGDSLLPQNQRIIKLPHKTKSIVFDFVAAEFENQSREGELAEHLQNAFKGARVRKTLRKIFDRRFERKRTRSKHHRAISLNSEENDQQRIPCPRRRIQ